MDDCKEEATQPRSSDSVLRQHAGVFDWSGSVRQRPLLGTQLRSLGYEVKLIAPQFVKPYVEMNKNDAADAVAICEAVGRPNMRFLPIKNVEPQAVHDKCTVLLRIRSADTIRDGQAPDWHRRADA